MTRLKQVGNLKAFQTCGDLFHRIRIAFEVALLIWTSILKKKSQYMFAKILDDQQLGNLKAFQTELSLDEQVF